MKFFRFLLILLFTIIVATVIIISGVIFYLQSSVENYEFSYYKQEEIINNLFKRADYNPVLYNVALYLNEDEINSIMYDYLDDINKYIKKEGFIKDIFYDLQSNIIHINIQYKGITIPLSCIPDITIENREVMISIGEIRIVNIKVGKQIIELIIPYKLAYKVHLSEIEIPDFVNVDVPIISDGRMNINFQIKSRELAEYIIINQDKAILLIERIITKNKYYSLIGIDLARRIKYSTESINNLHIIIQMILKNKELVNDIIKIYNMVS